MKTGKRPPDNLDDEFDVMLGVYTEDFNRAWFERKTELPVIAAGDFRVSRDRKFMQANIDGEVLLPNGKSALFEAKHTNSFLGLKGALALYQPQLHHNMMVTGFRTAYLSVIAGNAWDYVEVEFNEDYAKALLKAEEEFWECVTLDMPPSEIPEILDPPEATRVLDMTGNNEWAAKAADWLENKDKAKTFGDAADALKKLVAADVKSAKGHGIRIDRDKRRALRIRKDGDDGNE